MQWSQHRHAPYYLYSLSFAESSFFPIPPDFMLAPMALAKPQRAMTYALLTTISSVLGGLLGYAIGMLFMQWLEPYIIHFGYADTLLKVESWFKLWGFWVMFVAGFAPIPYKFFTIAAGAMQIPLLPFIIGSVFGRGGRFFLVALLIRWQGAKVERMLIKHIDRLGWISIGLILIGFTIYHYV